MINRIGMAFCCTSQKRRDLLVPGRNGKQLLDMTLVDGNHVRNALVLRKKVLREISFKRS
jgi:hypothetical protein